jgi:DUF2917 family protein
MLCTGYTKVWELAPSELVRLPEARGTTLRVTRGTLWVTLQNDARDIVLEAGDSYMIDRGGLTLVEAQKASTVCVLARNVEETRQLTARRTLARRIGARLAAILAPDGRRAYTPYY